MHYDINDPYFKEFKVSLNGKIREDALEANDEEGWIIVEIQVVSMRGGTQPWPKRLHGKVHIVRYEGYDEVNDDEPDNELIEEEPTYD